MGSGQPGMREIPILKVVPLLMMTVWPMTVGADGCGLGTEVPECWVTWREEEGPGCVVGRARGRI